MCLKLQIQSSEPSPQSGCVSPWPATADLYQGSRLPRWQKKSRAAAAWAPGRDGTGGAVAARLLPRTFAGGRGCCGRGRRRGRRYWRSGRRSNAAAELRRRPRLLRQRTPTQEAVLAERSRLDYCRGASPRAANAAAEDAEAETVLAERSPQARAELTEMSRPIPATRDGLTVIAGGRCPAVSVAAATQ